MHRSRAQERLQRLGRPLEDAQDPHVAQDLGRRVGLDVTAATEHLHEVVGGAPGELGAQDLARDGGIDREGTGVVHQRSHALDEAFEPLDPRRQVGEPGQDHGVVQEQARRHGAAAGVAQRELGAALHHADRHRRHAEAPEAEGVLGHVHPLPRLAQQRLGPDRHVVEQHGVLHHAAQAQRDLLGPEAQSPRSLGDDERRVPLRRAGGAGLADDDVDRARPRRRSAPDLLAPQEAAAAAILRGHRLDRPQVRPGPLFGGGEGAELASGGEQRKVLTARSFGGVPRDRPHAEHVVTTDKRRQREIDGAHLLQDAREVGGRERPSVVGLRRQHPHEAVVGHVEDEEGRNAAPLVDQPRVDALVGVPAQPPDHRVGLLRGGGTARRRDRTRRGGRRLRTPEVAAPPRQGREAPGAIGLAAGAALDLAARRLRHRRGATSAIVSGQRSCSSASAFRIAWKMAWPSPTRDGVASWTTTIRSSSSDSTANTAPQSGRSAGWQRSTVSSTSCG